MRIIPLGTNGFFPSFGRQTASYLVLTEDAAILLDAGTGMGRLREPEIAELLRPYDHLNVLLSHYHLDHCGGLAYLPGVWDRDVRIYAPGPPHNIAEPDDALGRLLDAPYSAPVKIFPFEVKVIPMKETSATIQGIEMRFRSQVHWCGSMGMRLGDDVAYVTDTIVDEGTIDLVRGVKLLLHEVWMRDEEVERDEVGRREHSYMTGVAEIGEKANVGKIMMIHHKPGRSPDEIDEMRRSMEEVSGRTVIAPEETQVYEV